MKYILVVLCALSLAFSAHAERFVHKARVSPHAVAKLNCKRILNLSSQGGNLYKSSNLHGGRGRSFLDQVHMFHGTHRLSIAGTNKNIIGCFGLWACDQPFGCRYYQAMCGDSASNSTISSLARRNGGSTNALIGDGSGLCFQYNTSLSRVGSVRK